MAAGGAAGCSIHDAAAGAALAGADLKQGNYQNIHYNQALYPGRGAPTIHYNQAL